MMGLMRRGVLVCLLGAFAAAPAADDGETQQALWDRWVASESHFFEIPEREMGRTFDLLAHFLDGRVKGRLNFIDVGCAVGDYLVLLDGKFQSEIFSIGIDPLDWPGRAPYSVFEQVAITNKDEGTYEFHIYGGNDPATSSLEKLEADHVTHDPAESGERFFHPDEIEKAHGVIQVPALHLSTIVERYRLAGEVIHFLKIDVQGTDLQAFLSLGKYTRNCLFVQLETIYSSRRSHTLYENQTLFEDERPVLEKLGFRLFNVARFPAGPEADVVWVNRKLFRKLHGARAPRSARRS
jgi:hypothetical protein